MAANELSSPMVGRTLQRYRIVEEVGHGGMAVVYRGVDEALEREVAVKLLHPHLAARAEHRRRLAREAMAVARLSHPNILEIFDFSGEDSPEAYLVTELIRGRTLRAFAAEHPFDPPELAAACVHELAGALAHAHAHGIVHRDLKPENVMIREDGPEPGLKLMDFGIAQMLDRDERMTVTGSLVGSPAHMAPEIIDGEEADERSDIFSLGTLLFWLAAGQLPFEAPSPGALLKKILSGEHEDPRSLRPSVSDALARIISGCLARRREERIASANEVREQLGRALAEVGIDRPSELLARFLRRPEETSSATRLGIARHLMTTGAQAAAERKLSRALSAYGRVITLMPGTPEAGEAREAIDRLKSRARWKRRGAVLGGVTFLSGAAALWLLQDAPVPAEEPPVVAEAAVASEAPPSAPQPAPVQSFDEPAAPAAPVLLPRTATPAPRPVIAAAARPQPARLFVKVFPFAEFVIDGKAYEQAEFFDGTLPAGRHEVLLRRDCCETEKIETNLAPGESRDIRIRLTPRPARLRLSVRGPADVGVLVDDEFVQYTSQLGGGELLVNMKRDASGLWEYDRVVRVSLFGREPGFREKEVRVQLNAGQVTELIETLEPAG